MATLTRMPADAQLANSFTNPSSFASLRSSRFRVSAFNAVDGLLWFNPTGAMTKTFETYRNERDVASGTSSLD